MKWTSFAGLLLLAVAMPLAAQAEDEPGFKSIFDGKTLEGWNGKPEFWSVEDGAITGTTTAENPTKGNTFILWNAPVDDFELKLSYKIVGGNSGIQYRSKEVAPFVISGYQGDFEAGDTYSGILYEEKGRGILCLRGQKATIGEDGKIEASPAKDSPELKSASAELQSNIKKEDWNEYEIIAQGNHLIHKINGKVTADVTDNQASKRAMSGLLALQLHAGPPMKVQFKNIRIKRTKLTDNRKKVVFVAGRPSHAPGDHEFNAGSLLLAKCLNENAPNIVTAVYRNGWPADPSAFDNADAVCMYADGGGGHPVNPHLEEVAALAKSGVGVACLHYGVEVPKGAAGDKFLDWIGGYFETHWSVNPHWTLEKTTLAEGHPVTRGVKTFAVNDEWYYHMRFRPNMEGVTAILNATPPASTLTRPDGPHSGNPDVRAKAGQPQTLAWAAERPDGGRGFGFTGGHHHKNWGNDDFRKLVLNALVWVAKADVPSDGIPSKVTEEELAMNLDPKGKKK